MSLYHLARKYIATRAAVRTGKPLWLKSDNDLATSGYFGPTAFNLLQNLLSLAIASPIVILGNSIKSDMEREVFDLAAKSDQCDLSWLMRVWESVTPLLIPAAAPFVIAWVTLAILGSKSTFGATSLRAYKYQNAATTLLTKCVFLSFFGVLTLCVGASLLLYSLVEKTGGLGFIAQDIDATETVIVYYTVLAVPIAFGIALLFIPTFFYARFLYRYTEWARVHIGETKNKSKKMTLRVFAATVTVALIALLLFALAIVAPPLGAEAIYTLRCSNYGLTGF